MTGKTIKQILYGLVAAAFLLVGGRELIFVGVSLKAVAGAGTGLILAFMAITGQG